LKILVTPNMVPSDSPFQLNTTDFSDLIPPLYQKYPNMLMELNCSVVQMPTCYFNASGAFINAVSHVDVYVIINGSAVFTFTLQA
jgi:hypothetical protein